MRRQFCTTYKENVPLFVVDLESGCLFDSNSMKCISSLKKGLIHTEDKQWKGKENDTDRLIDSFAKSEPSGRLNEISNGNLILHYAVFFNPKKQSTLVLKKNIFNEKVNEFHFDGFLVMLDNSIAISSDGSLYLNRMLHAKISGGVKSSFCFDSKKMNSHFDHSSFSNSQDSTCELTAGSEINYPSDNTLQDSTFLFVICAVSRILRLFRFDLKSQNSIVLISSVEIPKSIQTDREILKVFPLADFIFCAFIGDQVENHAREVLFYSNENLSTIFHYSCDAKYFIIRCIIEFNKIFVLQMAEDFSHSIMNIFQLVSCEQSNNERNTIQTSSFMKNYDNQLKNESRQLLIHDQVFYSENMQSDNENLSVLFLHKETFCPSVHDICPIAGGCWLRLLVNGTEIQYWKVPLASISSTTPYDWNDKFKFVTCLDFIASGFFLQKIIQLLSPSILTWKDLFYYSTANLILFFSTVYYQCLHYGKETDFEDLCLISKNYFDLIKGYFYLDGKRYEEGIGYFLSAGILPDWEIDVLFFLVDNEQYQLAYKYYNFSGRIRFETIEEQKLFLLILIKNELASQALQQVRNWKCNELFEYLIGCIFCIDKSKNVLLQEITRSPNFRILFNTIFDENEQTLLMILCKQYKAVEVFYFRWLLKMKKYQKALLFPKQLESLCLDLPKLAELSTLQLNISCALKTDFLQLQKIYEAATVKFETPVQSSCKNNADKVSTSSSSLFLTPTLSNFARDLSTPLFIKSELLSADMLSFCASPLKFYTPVSLDVGEYTESSNPLPLSEYLSCDNSSSEKSPQIISSPLYKLAPNNRNKPHIPSSLSLNVDLTDIFDENVCDKSCTDENELTGSNTLSQKRKRKRRKSLRRTEKSTVDTNGIHNNVNADARITVLQSTNASLTSESLANYADESVVQLNYVDELVTDTNFTESENNSYDHRKSPPSAETQQHHFSSQFPLLSTSNSSTSVNIIQVDTQSKRTKNKRRRTRSKLKLKQVLTDPEPQISTDENSVVNSEHGSLSDSISTSKISKRKAKRRRRQARKASLKLIQSEKENDSSSK